MDSNVRSAHQPTHVEQHDTIDNATLPTAIDKAFASGEAVQMRSSLDNLPTFRAVRIYWRISLICMMGAFCAALDGYRESIHVQYAFSRGPGPPYGICQVLIPPQRSPSPARSSPTRGSSGPCRTAVRYSMRPMWLCGAACSPQVNSSASASSNSRRMRWVGRSPCISLGSPSVL
jgi:hypothetical protein